MSIWRGLELLGIGVAVFVGGTAAGLTAAWVLSRIGRRYGHDETIDQLIKPPVQHFEGHDDALRQQSEARRVVAERLHRRARKAETGAVTPAEIVRMVKR